MSTIELLQLHRELIRSDSDRSNEAITVMDEVLRRPDAERAIAQHFSSKPRAVYGLAGDTDGKTRFVRTG